MSWIAPKVDWGVDSPGTGDFNRIEGDINYLKNDAHNILKYEANTVFIVPADITYLWVSLCGGGGGGCCNTSSSAHQIAGGGGARAVIKQKFNVTPGESISITIGAGGAGLTRGGTGTASTGGTSAFGSYLSCNGGTGGVNGTSSTGGAAGGTGGRNGSSVSSPTASDSAVGGGCLLGAGGNGAGNGNYGAGGGADYTAGYDGTYGVCIIEY
jgi:hypothetical protein